MKHDNPRTRFARTLEEAFPHDYPEQFDPLKQLPKDRAPVDYWVMLAVCYSLGFLTAVFVQV